MASNAPFDELVKLLNMMRSQTTTSNLSFLLNPDPPSPPSSAPDTPSAAIINPTSAHNLSQSPPLAGGYEPTLSNAVPVSDAPPRRLPLSPLLNLDLPAARAIAPACAPAPAGGPRGVTKVRRRGARRACGACGRTFREASAVRKHVRAVHLKLREFGCGSCGQRFAEKSNLKKHVQARHADARPFACAECHKAFHFTDGLSRHIKDCHLGLRPYDCARCSARFKQRSHLLKHRRSALCTPPPPSD